jgi:hypothetical protein
VTPETLRALAHDDAEAEQLAAMDLAHWINVPLLVSEQLLGSLGPRACRRRGPSPEEQLPFFEALAERAARGLANTQLITELRRTRGGSSGSSTRWPRRSPCHDARGKLVYANGAAATLLGAESVDELLAAEPGELAARFIITREDGTPVREEDLPGPAAAGRRGVAAAADPQRPPRRRGASTGC